VLRSFLRHFEENDGVLCINIAYASVIKSIRINTDLQGVKMYQLELNFPILSEEQVILLYLQLIFSQFAYP